MRHAQGTGAQCWRCDAAHGADTACVLACPAGRSGCMLRRILQRWWPRRLAMPHAAAAAAARLSSGPSCTCLMTRALRRARQSSGCRAHQVRHRAHGRRRHMAPVADLAPSKTRTRLAVACTHAHRCAQANRAGGAAGTGRQRALAEVRRAASRRCAQHLPGAAAAGSCQHRRGWRQQEQLAAARQQQQQLAGPCIASRRPRIAGCGPARSSARS